MPVLPNALDANVNNPNMFSSFTGGKKKTLKKRTMKKRKTRKTMKKRTVKKRTMKKRKSKCKR